MRARQTLILLSLVVSGPALSQEDLRSVFAELLPIGAMKMSVLGVAADPKVEAIARRMQANLAANSEWMASYLQQHEGLKPGEILPYHENFGVSEEEYGLFLSGMRGATLTSVGSLNLEISETETGLRIIAPQSTAFGEILIDLASVGVQTEYGDIRNCRAVLPDQANAAIGRWSGVTCRLEEGNPLEGDARNVVFSVGRIQDSERLFIQYVAQAVQNGALVRNVDLNLRAD